MRRRRSVFIVAVALGGSLVACSGSDADGAKAVGPAPAARSALVASMPTAEVSVSPGSTASDLALGASRALYRAAAVVVVAGASDVDSQARGASFAVALGAPLLLTPDPRVPPPDNPDPDNPDPDGPDPDDPDPDDRELRRELRRLGTATLLTVGPAAAAWAAAGDVSVLVAAPSGTAPAERTLGIPLGDPADVASAGLVTAIAALEARSPAVLGVVTAGRADTTVDAAVRLPPIRQPKPLAGLVVLTSSDPAWAAATATAVSAGADVQVLARPDPRGSSEAIAAISGRRVTAVVALGDHFGPLGRLADRVAVAATGVELPGGGQVVFPGRRLVSLYGTPGTASLGSLGEQDLDAAIARAREVAATYEGVSGEPVVPAFEIITTVASGAAGDDGDYSYEADRAEIERWVAAAGDAGVYVVLDLQPGRSDFLSQAQRYEELLRQPHVGLALDPEWRLEPDQVHLRQIGAVSAQEVNTVVTWLADLVAANDLPQKLLLLHQFRNSMITDRAQVDTSRDELAVLVHADGFGTQELKLDSWRNLRSDGADRFWWGWKNFYDEDVPTMTPEQTLDVEPAPVFISYQ